MQKVRQTAGTPNVKYFNQALTSAIRLFRETERRELVSLGINTTLTSYERTGVSPFNPFASAWTESIETLGMKEMEETKVSYEILVKEGAPELSDDEKQVLRSAFPGELYAEMLDSDIAMLLGEQILAKWRKAVEEGAMDSSSSYNEFARANLPSNILFLQSEGALVW